MESWTGGADGEVNPGLNAGNRVAADRDQNCKTLGGRFVMLTVWFYLRHRHAFISLHQKNHSQFNIKPLLVACDTFSHTRNAMAQAHINVSERTFKNKCNKKASSQVFL